MHKTFELVCQLPARAVLERIEGLLSKEQVEYKSDNLSVTSTKTPIVFFSFDRRLYSRANRVGLNPFTYVDSVDVRCEPADHGLTKVIVHVNRFRAFVLAAFWVANAALVAAAMPEPGWVIRAILFIGFACAGWFGTVSFFGGYLLKKEISDCLKDGRPARTS
jgi:hypothetical protein